MKKVFAILSAVMIMTTLFVTPAYAMGGRGYARGYAQTAYTAPRATNLNYTADNTFPTIDVDSLVAARKAYLNDLVTQGIVTQEYADALLNNYRTMLEYRAANGGYGYGGGFCGGFGGGFGGCGGFGGGFGGYYNR